MIAQNRKLATIHDSTLIVAVDIASQKHVHVRLTGVGTSLANR